MRSWIVILGLYIYIILTKTTYENGLNAAPYSCIMIIHLSSIKPNIETMRLEETRAQFTLTRHHIVGAKQGKSGTYMYMYVGLQIIDGTKKNIREENLILY